MDSHNRPIIIDQHCEHARIGFAARLCVVLVQMYQASFGLFLGGHCRFHPTCSNYAIEALRTHGALRGSWLTLCRVLRCHPLGGHGYDPVPPARDARANSSLQVDSVEIDR